MERGKDYTLDALARVIFLDPPVSGATMQLTLPDRATVKDLFFFLLDLFMRGALIMFCNGGDSVAVHEITAAQFDLLAARLRVAGIDCRRSDAENPCPGRASTNLADLRRAASWNPLESYRAQARMGGRVHTLWFAVTHVVAEEDALCSGGVHNR